MEINWLQEAQKRKEMLLEDLSELLRINSVRDIEHQTDEYPLGAGPALALKKVLSFGERDGFRVKNIDNLAGHIEYGEETAEALGILGHVDVVPPGEGWATDPFEPIVKEGKLFARGSSDDKGPCIAAYYGMKIIKELQLSTSKKIRFIFGTDEESEWIGIHHYMEKEEMPAFGFSPDANFPIINGEKGILSFELSFSLKEEKADKMQLKRFSSGLRANMVPSEAIAVLEIPDLEKLSSLEAGYTKYLDDKKLKGTFEYKEGEASFVLYGKAAHAQEPKFGINAGTYLADFLHQYPLDSSGSAYLSVIANYLHEDFNGHRLMVDYEGDVMGKVTSCANVFIYQQEGEKKIILNIRHPKGITKEKIQESLLTVLQNESVSISIIGDIKTPHYVSGDDPFIQTLLSVYEKHTGEKGYEQTIGGGTYGRILEKGCAYGSLFPGRENVMHQPNEYMYVEDILKATAIYAEAIYRLVK
ncbi:dipeptidase PepV [Enterococcus lactis]|uniref:dipeptidase PepV n=1 Tax=Enterococcus lactis TaxID=357441 RepID=UPI002DBC458E|nr:dipeptidase PepV [Enterococcus lactis]MEB7429304.1 dipeptidase PepV [Enterococcus lactis]